jgi:type I restriction enzyme S subunit
MPIPLPPLTEQISALTEVEAGHEVVKQQDEAMGLSIKQSTAQRQNILRAAFAGQLVPQDPNDEPASVLLERIRTERAVQATTKKPRGRKSITQD